jgi:hypothetical protein
MMTKTMRHTLYTLCLAMTAGMASHAIAQAAEPESAERKAAHAHRAAERTHIQEERKAIATRRLAAETECYKLFAVEDCLRQERNRAREAEAGLRKREMQINDAERKEKATERRRSIAEKQSAQPGPPGAEQEVKAGVRGQPSHTTRLPRTPRTPTVPTPAPDVHQREAERAQRAAETSQRAARARDRHAEELKTAQERRARVERDKAAAAAAGRKPAAPLPAPAP